MGPVIKSKDFFDYSSAQIAIVTLFTFICHRQNSNSEMFMPLLIQSLSQNIEMLHRNAAGSGGSISVVTRFHKINEMISVNFSIVTRSL